MKSSLILFLMFYSPSLFGGRIIIDRVEISKVAGSGKLIIKNDAPVQPFYLEEAVTTGYKKNDSLQIDSYTGKNHDYPFHCIIVAGDGKSYGADFKVREIKGRGICLCIEKYTAKKYPSTPGRKTEKSMVVYPIFSPDENIHLEIAVDDSGIYVFRLCNENENFLE